MDILRPARRILPLTTIQVQRTLPVPGKVVVNQGQIVKATQTVAEAHLEPKYHLVDVARALGTPRAQAQESVLCQADDTVRKGDVLAEKKGLVRKVVTAPTDGKVVLAADGYVLLQEYRSPWELAAGIPAKVVDVIPDWGVVLSTTGSLLDGVWGNGHLGYGLLHPVAKTPRDVLTPEALGVELRGLVLVVGHVENPRVLEIAENLPARAIITGTMSSSLLPAAREASFPLIVLDGFGEGGMNPAAFRLLSTSQGREAAVLADATGKQGERPLVIIPTTSTQAPPPAPPREVLTAGAFVRVTQAPYYGATARVVALLPGLTRFPNGVWARGVEIRLENGTQARVPVTNVEVLIQ